MNSTDYLNLITYFVALIICVLGAFAYHRNFKTLPTYVKIAAPIAIYGGIVLNILHFVISYIL